MAEATTIVFWVGDLLPGDLESETFAGFTFEEIRSDVETAYELTEPFEVFVNGELTSRKYHRLDYGDELRLVLYRVYGQEKAVSVAENEVAHPAEPPVTVDLQTSEATVKGGKTYPLDPVHAAVVDVLVKAKGNPVSRAEMRRRSPKLHDYAHLEREIDGLPPAILDLIERIKGRGYCLPWG